ncbi:PEP-CTERM sorting domain-containing protein [Aquabacterium sp.]|uniref:PEP-CTERM sorting domain-containing protein n=1 Tax=Aquabacterium sp. TaxID=1872578 RepID=UPI0035B0D422
MKKFTKNELGVRMCHELGKALTGRIRSAWSSPVLRCVQTAELLCQAADVDKAVNLDRRLGAPGVYVLDEEIAWNNWLAKGNHGVIKHLVSGVGALPGMADPSEAANALVKHMLDNSGCEQGVHLFVSHDSIVAPTVARVFDAAMTWGGMMKKLAIGMVLHALMLATGLAHATSSSSSDFISADLVPAETDSIADATASFAHLSGERVVGFKQDRHGEAFWGTHGHSPTSGWSDGDGAGHLPHWSGHDQVMSTPVPEPSTAMLQILGLGALGVAVRQVRRGTRRV